MMNENGEHSRVSQPEDLEQRYEANNKIIKNLARRLKESQVRQLQTTTVYWTRLVNFTLVWSLYYTVYIYFRLD